MIDEALVKEIISTVENAYLGEAVLQELREKYPEVRVTYCMQDDVSENAKPAYQCEGFNVYYIDAREHCMCLTNDIDVAAGIVLAEVFDEDED